LSAAEFVAVNYGQATPDVRGREVYILDFFYPRGVMEELDRQATRLVCLDHHKTAEEELRGFVGERALVRFDMGKSGGRLAWEFFFPDQPQSPWLVDYTEDRDLWRWRLARSREINAAVRSYPLDFISWYTLAERAPSTLAVEGEAILRYQQQEVDSHCAQAVEVGIGGYQVLAVNATTLQSEICERLAQGRPFGVSFFIRQDGQKIWSLRSRAGGIDVSEVARKLGGGGHKQAAGFQERNSP
jgi:oligoribonuclease NrnB/cAMP/cGMP phosphodiesterase (DHH superfamily)